MHNAVTHVRAYRRLLTAGVITATATLAVGPATPAGADTSPATGLPATVSADALPTVQINGVVWSQVTVGDAVYATGSFTSARPAGSPAGTNETPRGNLIAYSISTGNMITSFNHTLNAQGLVVTASPDGSRVYVGGDFTTVDGVARGRVAAFDTASGALVTTFAPTFSSRVRALAATNSTLYVGGNFQTAAGTGGTSTTRTRLAALSTNNGALTAWAPTADDNLVRALVLSPDGSRVIVGGHFSTLNGVAAPGMGAVSTANGLTLPWAANQTIKLTGDNNGISTLRTDGTNIYGGAIAYGQDGTRKFEGTFAANPTTGKLVWLTDCNGDTYDVFPIGRVLYHTGHSHDCSVVNDFPDSNPRVWYHTVAGTTYPSAINSKPDQYGWNYTWTPASAVLDWFPKYSLGTYTGQSQAAWSVTGNANYLAVGGEFPKVNGVAQQGLVRFAVKALAPNKMGPVAADTLTPSVTSPAAGKASITWTSTYDVDNELLTYAVLRDGNSTPIYTTTMKSRFWKLPKINYVDTVAAGTHTYQIRVTDPTGNVITGAASAPVTVK